MNESAYPDNTQEQVRYPDEYQSADPMFATVEPGDCTRTQAYLQDPDQPIPYTLTAKAETLLAHEAGTAAGPDAEAGS